MDWFDGSSAPAEYQAVAWIADLAQLGQGLGWAINYATMAHRSYQESTYGMSILPLCCNFAWELVYTFIYPPHNPVEKFNITLYLILNVFIMSFAVRFAPREWSHAPMVQRNIPLIFLFGTIAFILAHIALAKTAGAGLAANWGAFFCLELLIAGAWCQLLGRGSSRGTSYTIWYVGFLSFFLPDSCIDHQRKGPLDLWDPTSQRFPSS